MLDNIAKVDKVISQPGGSLVMAGRSGVGRRTALSLVAHMHQINVVSPKVSRAYGIKQFKNDLKTVCRLHLFIPKIVLTIPVLLQANFFYLVFNRLVILYLLR